MPETANNPLRQDQGDQLTSAFAGTRTGFIGVALFSAVINILALTGAVYMLQLYDRVLASHSVETLVGLTLIMVMLYAALCGFDILRMRILCRIGVKIERALRDQVLATVVARPLRTGVVSDHDGPVRDLEQIRKFLSGLGPTALFDLPWIPLYIAVIYFMHADLGLLAIGGGVVLAALAILTELSSRVSSRAATATAAARNALGAAVQRNAEAVRANGMDRHLQERWSIINESHLSHHVTGLDVAAKYSSLTKVLRMMLQSLVLGLGAYLVIQGEVTAGVMTAASLLVARAMAPVELAIANWRSFIATRQSWQRLRTALEALPSVTRTLQLAPPKEKLQATGLWVAAPGLQGSILKNVSFDVSAGDGLGIIGASASGKSTLARALVGVWETQRGDVRLDGAALDQWQPQDLGQHIGYLPQDVELFAGTVAENIARFDPQAGSAAIIAAGRDAGVHDMILGLPGGYHTEVGEAGAALSCGQRQRIGLARALFANPFLVVLDEPNSNLDSAGDVALTQAIASVRARAGIVIVIAHRPSALAGLDKLLVLEDGQVKHFGPKQAVLRQSVKPVPSAASGGLRPVKAVASEPAGTS